MSQHPPRYTWTYSEYARFPDDGNRYEVIDGEVLVTPAPTPRHQHVLLRLSIALHQYVERWRLGIVLPDVDLLFATGQFLRPDLLFVPEAARSGITDRGVELAPGLVVEVLSPTSSSDVKPACRLAASEPPQPPRVIARIVIDIYNACMIVRDLHLRLEAAARQMPAVAVLGPRQSGKTTLCRAAFPQHAYVSLEAHDLREYATKDPRGFLATYGGGVILDEVQRTPELFSYLQGEIDSDPSPGRFVLTGSQHFGLTDAIGQSLAGRIALLRLLPLSLGEIARFPSAPQDLWTTLWTGGYPRIYDRGLDPASWLLDYVETYLQRDVRQVLNVTDLLAFTTFLKLCAARTGQEQNLSSLGSDAGVSHNTARSWLSVLEASFILFRIPPWLRNLRKRAVKAPKLHFIDSGLVCHLLGIRAPDQLRLHPLRGAVFESWVASEVLKARLHHGRAGDLHHLREARGLEVDLIVEDGLRAVAVEAKTAATIGSDFFKNLEALRERVAAEVPLLQVEPRLIYGGSRRETRHAIDVLPWSEIQNVEW